MADERKWSLPNTEDTMTTYEVRTSKTIFNYYRFEAKDAAHAEQMALTFGKIGRIDTVHDKKKVDYSKAI